MMMGDEYGGGDDYGGPATHRSWGRGPGPGRPPRGRGGGPMPMRPMHPPTDDFGGPPGGWTAGDGDDAGGAADSIPADYPNPKFANR